MFAGRLTHFALRFLDGACGLMLPREETAGHRDLGQRGELSAYFFLRKRGYIMVAQNFRSPRRKGEIDLIGWSGDTLCFIEVKTRRSQSAEPAESAVDKKKRKDVIAVAREFLRNLPPACAWRFDLVTVYYDGAKGVPRFELFIDVLPL
jgi:putative endonuclease